MAAQSMRIVDAESLHREVEHGRFQEARQCRYFAADKATTPCLWHRSYCLHPMQPDARQSGHYQHCTLVWHGQCEFIEAIEGEVVRLALERGENAD